MMVSPIVRARSLYLLAFVFFLLASLVSGHIVSSSDLNWYWLVSGGLAAMVLAAIE